MASMTFKVATLLLSGDGGVDDGGSRSALKIKEGDITQWFVDGFSDVIVNSANKGILGGGGGDGAIHRAARPELQEACYKPPEVRLGIRCPTGEASITLGFKLPASHVIYTVGPIYDVDGNLKPPEKCIHLRFVLVTDDLYNVWLKTVKEFARSIVCVKQLIN